MSKYKQASEGFEAGNKAKKRPDVVLDEHLEYLDELRESGETNMFGATPWLKNAFPELSAKEAATILGYWMKTFGEATR